MDFIYMYTKTWNLARGERYKIIIYTLLHTISVVAFVCQPLAFAMVINQLQKQDSDYMKSVVMWLGAYVLCFYIFELCHRSARYFELSTAYHNKQKFILDTYDRLQKMPLSWHVDHHSGNIIGRVNKAGDALYIFGVSIYEYITAIIKFFGSIFILSRISLIAALISIFAGVIVVLFTKKMNSLSMPQYAKLNEGFFKIAATLQDGLSNITTIILLRLGGCVRKDIKEQLDYNYQFMMGDNKYTQVKCHINSFIEVVLNVGIVFYYIFMCQKTGKVVMLGVVTAIFQYVGKIMESFWFYATEYERVIRNRIDFESVEQLFDSMDTMSQARIETAHSIMTKDWKQLKLGPINFTYDNNKCSLKQIEVQLQKGSKIAFVGESGSGKSTMLKIIRGVLSGGNGSVVMDGNDVLPVSALSEITTLIPQEAEIFDHSVRYNITMGLPTSDAEIQEALWISKFDEVIPKLPHGLESKITENGVNLSGGEKQRLALARGIFSIKDNEIILLDEPTGSLDAVTEASVYQHIFERYGDRCIVSVLHRLHLLSLFDYIYVFHNGEIVEEGTLDHLKSDGEYFKFLWEQYQMEDK